MLSFSTERDNERDDVTLIQKANLVLKTAGLNASVISIDQLQFTIPVIVVKVFESFFGHQLDGINYSPSNRYDHENNADIVVHALQSRYQYESLDGVSGAMLVKGDRSSIEIIIDIFYGISQKIINKSEKELRSNKLEESTAKDGPIGNAPEKKDTAIPGELNVLMNRVAYLEEKLYDEDKYAADEKDTKKKRKKKRRTAKSRSQAGDILNTAHDDDHRAEGKNSTELRPTSPTTGSGPTSPARRKIIKGQKKKITRRRPTSAPAGGRRRPETAPETSPPKQQEKPAVVPSSPPKKKEYDESNRLYTYDTWTGRRVLKAELEYLTEQRRRKYQAMGITPPEVYNGRVDGDGNSRGPINRRDTWSQPSPTKAEYPGPHTEQSVDAYLQKMKRIRNPKADKEKDPYKYLDTAQMFNSYRHMDPLDIVISIEHCHSCEQHPMTLRHKTHEYISHADEIMRHLAMAAHSAHPCARVGVIRFPADIKPHPRNPDAHLRIGAFEVQVAYKDHRGQVLPELLHSKLKTRRWPSKTVLEKRIAAFFSKAGVQTHTEAGGQAYEETSSNGLGSYPVGIGEWEEVPLSSATWTYIPPEGHKTLSESIQWAFDARGFAHYPKFAVGTTVRVYNAPNDWDGVERYSCVGVVKRAFKDMSTNTDMLAVRLRYHDTEIECESDKCESMSEVDQSPAPNVLDYELGVPAALALVLKFASSDGLLNWKNISSEDHVLYRQGHDEYHLSRSSFYQQIRELTWAAVNSRPGATEGYMADIKPNGEEEDVDVQVAYSEAVLDWAFNKWGKLVNTYDLMKMIQLAPPLPSRGTKTPTAWGKSESFGGGSKADESEDAMGFLRKRIQAACLTLAPPPKGNSPRTTDLDSSMYKPGAQKIFDRFDDDKSGTLNKTQFGRALDSFGIEYKKSDLDQLWVLLDLDGDSFICLPELMTFLQFSFGVGYRELGEIWEIIRKVSQQAEGGGYSLLEEMEKDMFSMCIAQDGVGSVLTTEVFKKVLKKFGILDALRPGDMRILVAYHGVDVHGQPVSESILSSQGTDVSLKKYHIRFDDFCSWLQPVDFVSVCKKISEVLQNQDQNIHFVKLESGLHTVGPNETSTKETFLKHNEVAMDVNPTINVSATNCLVEKFDFVTTRVDAHTISLQTTCLDEAETGGWAEALEVEWEMYGPEESIEGIPISTVDPEQTGLVTKVNFKAYLEDLGVDLSDAEMRSLYRNFGQDDGNTMTYDQLHRLVTTHVATHRFIPLIGSRAYRKKSIIGGAGLFADLGGESNQKREGSAEEDVYTDDFAEDDDLENQATMSLNISQLELRGRVLNSKPLRKFKVEVKYLLQEFSVDVSSKNKRGAEARVLDDLDWEPILLTSSALKMNADVSVSIISSDENILGVAYFSPNQLLVDAKVSESHSVPLSIKCGDHGDIEIELLCRIRETQKTRAERFKRMQTSDLLAVSFRSEEYNNSGYEESGPEYLADFAVPGEEDFESSVVKKDDEVEQIVPVSEDVMYLAHIRKICVKDLVNVEVFGMNDPYVVIKIGSLYSFRTSVLKDAGEAASWKYQLDDPNMVFEARGSQLLSTPLSVEVFDHNVIKADVIIGSGSSSISSSGDISVDIYSENELGKNRKSGSVTISLSFKVGTVEQKLLSVTGNRTVHIPTVHFTLNDSESRKKHSYCVLTIHDWIHESSVVTRADGSCHWHLNDAIATLDASVLRKQALTVKVYTTGKKDTLVGEGSASIRDLLIEKSSPTHPMQFGIDVMNAEGDRTGRAVLAAFVESDSETALDTFISPRSEDEVTTDRDVLLAFFESTGGNGSWYDTCFWSKDVDLSGWLNIDLNSDCDRVTGLRVGSNGLTGSIPKDLYRLDLLTELELFGNGLTGCIPHEIGDLIHLRTLLLNHNSLSGSIPSSLAKCINLEELDLSNNLLSGEIPSELAIQRLMTVNLSSNQFSGNVPLSFVDCKVLKSFLCDLIPYDDEEFYKTFDWIKAHADITKKAVTSSQEYQQVVRREKGNLILFSEDMEYDDDCFMEWIASEKIDSWPGVEVDDGGMLRSLKLSNSSLRGMISGKIELFSTLVFLDLSNNGLEGFIPDEIIALQSLKFVYLNDNNFEGSLPSDLQQLTHLKTLNLRGNQLSGELSDTWDSFRHLEVLDLSSNQFEGALPESLFSLEGLRELNLSDNAFTGSIPEMSALVTLENLGLAKNKLKGCIPESIGSAQGLRFFDVSFTPLSGKLPTSLQNLSHLEEMRIQMTNLDLGDLDAQTAKTVIVKRMPSLRKVSL